MPCLRHKSLVWAPASDSARMAMICSSVNLLFLMTPPLRRSPIITGSGFGGQLIGAALARFAPATLDSVLLGAMSADNLAAQLVYPTLAIGVRYGVHALFLAH